MTTKITFQEEGNRYFIIPSYGEPYGIVVNIWVELPDRCKIVRSTVDPQWQAYFDRRIKSNYDNLVERRH